MPGQSNRQRRSTTAPTIASRRQAVELYPVQVAFEYIASAEERSWFKNLPTAFELPRETIDRLRDMGRRLLAEDPKFQELMKALDGYLPANGQTC